MRFLFTMIAVALAAPTAAQQGGPQARLSPECRAEIVKLCPPNGDRNAMRQCLIGKRSQLSGGCMEALRAMRVARQGGGDIGAPGAMKTEPAPK